MSLVLHFPELPPLYGPVWSFGLATRERSHEIRKAEAKLQSQGSGGHLGTSEVTSRGWGAAAGPTVPSAPLVLPGMAPK